LLYFMAKEEITTIKLNKKTKERIDKLKIHSRESYEELLQRMLGILNVTLSNPEKARAKLVSIEKQNKIMKQKKKSGD